MPKKNRLTRNRFASLGKPKTRKTGTFSTISVYSTKEGVALFACVVSKKTARFAHERNSIKRRFRAALRDLCAECAPNSIYVFTANKDALRAPYRAIRDDVATLLSPFKSL